MAHFHWPLITKKSHQQLKRLQILWVLNEYHAFWLGWRHLKLVLKCFGAQNSITNDWVWIPSEFKINFEHISIGKAQFKIQASEFKIHYEFPTHPLLKPFHHVFGSEMRVFCLKWVKGFELSLWQNILTFLWVLNGQKLFQIQDIKFELNIPLYLVHFKCA